MRPFFIILIILFFILQYELWFSSGGLVQIWQLRKTMANLNLQNEQLRARNAILEADVNDLKQGNEAIEERARNNLGMIKKGETFYQVAK
jgi:cell division protein FtsB